MTISSNTQAILLLTAPLIIGRGRIDSDQLTVSEYNQVVRWLRDNHREPADLLGPEAPEILQNFQSVVEVTRLQQLIGRGFLLSQALERWQARGIWVMSRADPEYPKRLKERLKESAPPVLYGCGDSSALDSGGLAVVGSRNGGQVLSEYAANVGGIAASAGRQLVSGAAHGIDLASMTGALMGGGTAVGVLANGLESASVERDNRNFLMDGRLVLISPYDPSSGFNVEHAMQRNKLIYALSDSALIVDSDYQKGGTWAGAVEQLENMRLIPVYIRSVGDPSKGLEALSQKGALAWPNPTTDSEFNEVLAAKIDARGRIPHDAQLSFPIDVEKASRFVDS